MSKNINLADAINLTDREYHESFIGNSYIIDMGIISNISSDKKTVDIIHATLPMKNGIAGQPIKSTGIEILWNGCKNFQLQYDLQIGDTVLLVGMKNFIPSVSGLNTPAKPSINLKYTQETMKAIPFSVQPNAQAIIKVTSSEMDITTKQTTLDIKINGQELKIDSSGITMLGGTEPFVLGTQLYTQLTTIVTALQTFTTGLTVPTLAAQAASCATAMGTALGLLSQIKSTQIKGK